MKLRFLGTILMLLNSSILLAQPSPESFDLKKSIQFAIEHSPTFDSLRRELSIAKMQKQVALARILPSLDLTATHGAFDSKPRGSIGPWESEFNLALTESLYDNGVSFKGNQVAKLNQSKAELRFEDQKNKLSLDIATQFLQYSLNRKLTEIQEKQFKLVNKQYDLISKDYYQGIKTKNDFLRFKTQVSRSEIAWISANNFMERSKQELQKIIGLGLENKIEVEFVPFSLESVQANTIENSVHWLDHPQYKAVVLQKRINELGSEIVGRRNLPEWFVTAGVNYQSSNYIGTGSTFSDGAVLGWNALLTVKYNFFDWGIRSGERDIAIESNKIQNNTLDSDLLTLKASLNLLESTLIQSRKNYSLSKELLSLEKNNLDFIGREYRNGKVAYLDFITGLNNLSDAEIKYYSATSDLGIAEYTMLYHQGKLYEELLK